MTYTNAFRMARRIAVATPTQGVARSIRRTISTTTTREAAITQTEADREWLVVLPDHDGVLDRRIHIRPRHSPNFVALHKAGWVSWAGPIFTDCVPRTHPRRPFCGSIMVVNEASEEGIIDVLSKDIYVKERIWDMGATKIYQFQTLKRTL